MQFLEKIIGINQHAYRTNHSTVTAMVDLVSQILNGFDKNGGKYSLVVFCDISKTFDMVNHQILEKM